MAFNMSKIETVYVEKASINQEGILWLEFLNLAYTINVIFGCFDFGVLIVLNLSFSAFFLNHFRASVLRLK